MPRYFFNVDGPSPSKDDEGLDLPDMDAIKQQADLSVRELLAAAIFPVRADHLAPSRVRDGRVRDRGSIRQR